MVVIVALFQSMNSNLSNVEFYLVEVSCTTCCFCPFTDYCISNSGLVFEMVHKFPNFFQFSKTAIIEHLMNHCRLSYACHELKRQ